MKVTRRRFLAAASVFAGNIAAPTKSPCAAAETFADPEAAASWMAETIKNSELTQHAYAIRRETSCSLRKALLIRLDPNRLPPLAELMGQPGARPAASTIPSISSALSMRKRGSTRPHSCSCTGAEPTFSRSSAQSYGDRVVLPSGARRSTCPIHGAAS